MGRIEERNSRFYYIHTRFNREETIMLNAFPYWINAKLASRVDFLDTLVANQNKSFEFDKVLTDFGYQIYKFTYIPSSHKGPAYFKQELAEEYNIKTDLIKNNKMRICSKATDYLKTSNDLLKNKLSSAVISLDKKFTLEDCFSENEVPKEILLNYYAVFILNNFEWANVTYIHIRILRLYSKREPETLYDWYFYFDDKNIEIISREDFNAVKNQKEKYIEDLTKNIHNFNEYHIAKQEQIVNEINNCSDTDELEKYFRKQLITHDEVLPDKYVTINDIISFKLYLNHKYDILKEKLRHSSSKLIKNEYNNYVLIGFSTWLNFIIAEKENEKKKQSIDILKKLFKSFVDIYTIDKIIETTALDDTYTDGTTLGFIQTILLKANKNINKSVDLIIEYFPFDKFDIINSVNYDIMYTYLRNCIVIAYVFINKQLERNSLIIKDWEKSFGKDIVDAQAQLNSGTNDPGLNRSADYKRACPQKFITYKIKPRISNIRNLTKDDIIEISKNLNSIVDKFNDSAKSGTIKELSTDGEFIYVTARVYIDDDEFAASAGLELAEGRNQPDLHRINNLTKLYNIYYGSDDHKLTLTEEKN